MERSFGQKLEPASLRLCASSAMRAGVVWLTASLLINSPLSPSDDVPIDFPPTAFRRLPKVETVDLLVDSLAARSSDADVETYRLGLNARLPSAAEQLDKAFEEFLVVPTPVDRELPARELMVPFTSDTGPAFVVTPTEFMIPPPAGRDGRHGIVETAPVVEEQVLPTYQADGWFPASLSPTCPVNCPTCGPNGTPSWNESTVIPWDLFAQGDYIGPHRTPHVPEYRVRVDDLVNFVFRITAEPSYTSYEFNVGDQLRIESLTQPELDRQVTIQPDGNITARLLGQVPAGGRSIEALRDDLEERYRSLVKDPAITVTPLQMNTRLMELRNTVDSRFGVGGQTIEARVSPDGTVQLPGLGSVPVQGLNLAEIRHEVNRRYLELVSGMDVTPVLAARAPRFAYVLGEVARPGRIELLGPTTVLQAISMAGSWNFGARLRQIVILRRDENWELMATRVNLQPVLYGNDPCPPGELWLRDSDIVVVPMSATKFANEKIDQIFTRGIYAVFPVSFNYQLRGLTRL